MWRVKLVAERHPGVTAETELACIERDEPVGVADLRLWLDEAKRLTAALQARRVGNTDGRLGRVSSRIRGMRAQGGRRGVLPGDVLFPVR